MSARISIFTPTHNSQYITEAYESIKDQDFYEWIVVHNNGSEPFHIDDPRVKQYKLSIAPKWVGPLKAFACEQAKGDILLELDHDDVLMPTAIEEVKQAFEDDEVGFVYSNTIHATGDWGKVARFNECYGWKYREVEYNGHLLDEHISFEPTPDSISRIWFAPNHLRAFRRTAYEAVGGFSKEMRILDDLDLMCRLYKVTKFKHIDKGLYIYRVHGKNTWLDPEINKEIQANVYRIHDQYAESMVSHWAEENGLRRLELGGRVAARADYETVDLRDADIICDLDGKWPFADNSVGLIRAIDVFEHLRDPIHVMKEMYRVLAPGAWAFLQIPSTDGRGAFQDPTHVSFWNENSFGYYTQEKLASYIDTPVRFQALRLYTTDLDAKKVCWVIAHLVCLKDDFRPAGLIEI